MTFWSPDSVRSAIGGSWLRRPDAEAPAPELLGASTDSRTITPGQVFFALRTDKADGHSFIGDALARGAGLVVVDRPQSVQPPDYSAPARGVLHVPDARAALLRLAAAYRRTLEATRVIAVGGSNGKTTTVRLLEQVLRRNLRGTASPKSFNNDIGVPLTVLAAKRSDQFLICEVGTNAPGELRPLAEALAPDIGVITSIGREHLEGFGSLEGVVREEASLAAGLREGGVLIHTSDSPELREAVRPLLATQRASALTFGTSTDADLRVSAVSTGATGTTFTLNSREELRVGLLGTHNALNAAAVVAVARRLGLPPTKHRVRTRGGERRAHEARARRVRRGLVPQRRVQRQPGVRARLAEDVCRGRSWVRPPRRRARRHAGTGRRGPARPRGDRRRPRRSLAGLRRFRRAPHGPRRGGRRSRRYARVIDRDHRHCPRRECPGRVAALLRPGDAVLLKGSRGMALESVLAAHRTASPTARHPALHHT